MSKQYNRRFKESAVIYYKDHNELKLKTMLDKKKELRDINDELNILKKP